MFITFEGPDGSGKSTIIEKLKEYFDRLDREVIQTREPGGTTIGEEIRSIILDPKNKEMDNRTEALLYAASRTQLVSQVIRPALAEGKIVITDRFLLSSLAYQGYGRELGMEEVESINRFGIGNLEPDAILFFQIDPITTLYRKKQREDADRLERLSDDFHKKVYRGYMDYVQKHEKDKNFYIIDCEKTVEEVYAQVIQVLESVLGGEQ